MPVTDRIAEDVRNGRINAILVTSGSVAEQVHLQFPDIPAVDGHRRHRTAHREGRPAGGTLGRRRRRDPDGRRADRSRRAVHASARCGRIRTLSRRDRSREPPCLASSWSPEASADRGSRSVCMSGTGAQSGCLGGGIRRPVHDRRQHGRRPVAVGRPPAARCRLDRVRARRRQRRPPRLGEGGRQRTGQSGAAGVGRRLAVVHPRRPGSRHAPRPHGLASRGLAQQRVIERMSRRWPLGARLLPMTDSEVDTQVVLRDGPRPPLALPGVVDEAPRCTTSRHGSTRRGVDAAVPAPGVLEAIADADIVLIAPSNPVVSIGPILAVPGIREALRSTDAAVVGVSPIIGGRVVRGMADVCLAAIGVETSASCGRRALRRTLRRGAAGRLAAGRGGCCIGGRRRGARHPSSGRSALDARSCVLGRARRGGAVGGRL